MSNNFWNTSNSVYGNWYNSSNNTRENLSTYPAYIRNASDYSNIFTPYLRYRAPNNTGVSLYRPNLNRSRNTISGCMTIKKLREISELCVADGCDRCSICQDNIENSTVVRKLNCSHKFHPNCIDEWFDNNNTCPLCMKRF